MATKKTKVVNKSTRTIEPAATEERSHLRAGALIREARERAEMSIRDLANKMDYSHYQFLSRIELGYAALPRKYIWALCQTLNVEPRRLLDAMAQDHYDSLAAEVNACAKADGARGVSLSTSAVSTAPSPRNTEPPKRLSPLRLFKRAG